MSKWLVIHGMVDRVDQYYICTRVKAGRDRERSDRVARNYLKHQRFARYLSRFLRRARHVCLLRHAEDALLALFLYAFCLLPINWLVRHFSIAIGLLFDAIDAHDPVLGGVGLLQMFQLSHSFKSSIDF